MIPSNHLTDATLLTADGIVELFEIVMLDGSLLRVKNDNTVTYMGITYEGYAIELKGAGRTSDEQVKRPTLSIVNPNGVFTDRVINGKFEFAKLYRRRVLYNDLLVNSGRYVEEMWLITRCTALAQTMMSFELRAPSDRFNTILPARMFILPEFPLVVLR